MAKGQGGRRRAPVRRGGGGWRRVLLAFVAGLVVAGAGLWWLQRSATTAGSPARRWVAGVLGMPRPAEERGEVPPQSGRGQTVQGPRSAGPVPAAPGGAAGGAPAVATSENGVRGVPGEPGRATAGQPPFGESEEVFEAGARVYAAQCASCHGRPGRSAAAEKGELAAGQFWTPAGGRAVAGQAVGQIFAEIANGAPQRQMPAYRRVLTEAQMWDLALLLKNAGSELPDPVVGILKTGR